MKLKNSLILLGTLCTFCAHAFSPLDISGLQLSLESRFGDDILVGANQANSGQMVTKWLDRSSHHRDATNTVSGPQLFTSAVGGPTSLRFYTTNYLGLVRSPITSAQTTWTVCSVFRVNSVQSNSTVFDITETAQSASVLVRQMWNGTAFGFQTMVRDSGFVPDMPQFSDDCQAVKVVTSTRNGNTVSIRINGVLVASVGTNTLGSMYGGSYYPTVGAVRNGFGFGNALSGDILAVTCYDSVISDSQLDDLENYFAQYYRAPLVLPARVGTSPVIGLGAAGSGEEARLLEPSVLWSPYEYKMYYCGSSSNGANLHMGWSVFLATSTDGTNWTKQGVVLTNAWEPDVILVNSVYYMAHTEDTAYHVNLAWSNDGRSWVDVGTIVSTNTSPWSNNGPREASLYYENGTFYCYYADMPTGGGKYHVGCAVCTNDPTVLANWVCVSTPLFFATSSGPRWNSGASTESPCVRYYGDLPHPYLMTFIGYNPPGIVVNYPWRGGVAYADSPLGPWFEINNNPVFTVGNTGGWDDRISAEMTHMQVGTNWFGYYSGGKYNGSNQVGMVVLPISSISKLMK